MPLKPLVTPPVKLAKLLNTELKLPFTVWSKLVKLSVTPLQMQVMRSHTELKPPFTVWSKQVKLSVMPLRMQVMRSLKVLPVLVMLFNTEPKLLRMAWSTLL